MSTIFIALTILIVIAAILLCIVVLLQNGKGEGMASNFISANQTLGVRQTADILEKTSWILVTFILVVSVVTSILTTRKGATEIDITDKVEVAAPEFPSAPVESAAPATDASATEAPATETPNK
ncbi:MAG: preprotein translocase subunit SecG [Candidatus Cryptobacteroides sp.]